MSKDNQFWNVDQDALVKHGLNLTYEQQYDRYCPVRFSDMDEDMMCSVCGSNHESDRQTDKAMRGYISALSLIGMTQSQIERSLNADYSSGRNTKKAKIVFVLFQTWNNNTVPFKKYHFKPAHNRGTKKGRTAFRNMVLNSLRRSNKLDFDYECIHCETYQIRYVIEYPKHIEVVVGTGKPLDNDEPLDTY